MTAALGGVMAFEAAPPPRSWRARHPSSSKATKLARLQGTVRRFTRQALPVVERMQLAELPQQHREALRELERELRSVEEILEEQAGE